MNMNHNQKTVTLKLKRYEVCDLLLACTTCVNECEYCGLEAKKWHNLRSKIFKMLNDFDVREATKK